MKWISTGEPIGLGLGSPCDDDDAVVWRIGYAGLGSIHSFRLGKI